MSTDQPFSALPETKLEASDLKPCQLEGFTQVRFSKSTLSDNFQEFLATAKGTDFARYETELYEITKLFHESLKSKPIDSKCIRRFHHIQQLLNKSFPSTAHSQELLNSRFDSLLQTHPALLNQYEVYIRMIHVFNALIAKWGIAVLHHYEYRLEGRAQNVKMLDLAAMNRGFISTDVVWIACRMGDGPLQALATPLLRELAAVLTDQINTCFHVFLSINQIEENFEFEKTLAMTLETKRRFSGDVLPEENLSKAKIEKLEMVKGILSWFKKKNKKVQEGFSCLKELELANRTFEKALIARILSVTGKT
jgi:hypothetical protein